MANGFEIDNIFFYTSAKMCNDDMYEIIIKIFFERSSAECLELCKQFYDDFHRLPHENEVYKDFRIWEFMQFIADDGDEEISENTIEEFSEDTTEETSEDSIDE